MMNRNHATTYLAAALMVVGMLVILVATFADQLNIGSGDGFGYYQKLIMIGGGALVVGGIGILLARMFPSSPPDDFEPEP